MHTVTNIENRAANVRLDTVNRLAIALNVDPCLLLSTDPAEAPGDYVERPLGDSVTQNLKRLRLRLSLTQEQAATSAGLGRVYAYKIESKTVAATLDALDALARVVGVETWQLLV
ncbi:helix-turn-helix transcriptional regulator [Paraburkholderia dipogonis]